MENEYQINQYQIYICALLVEMSMCVIKSKWEGKAIIE